MSCTLCFPSNHAPQEFPDVERLHKAKQLDKMCSKGLWGVSVQSLLSLGQAGNRLCPVGCIHPAFLCVEGCCPAHPPGCCRWRASMLGRTGSCSARWCRPCCWRGSCRWPRSTWRCLACRWVDG